MDFRRSNPHLPITLDGTPVEIVDSYKNLGVHISGDLTWSAHVSALIKRTQGTLFHLRRLRKHTKSPALLKAFYSATVESVLANSITSWYGNCSGQDRKRLTRVIKAAERTTRSTLPRLEDIYSKRCRAKAERIMKDSSHPDHHMFEWLRSGRRLRHLAARTERLKNSFFPQAIRALNTL